MELPSEGAEVMVCAAVRGLQRQRRAQVSEDAPQFDPSSDGGEGPQASSQNVSKLMLWVGVAVMLLPAGIPLYFALGAENGGAIVLFALAAGVAVVNMLLVFGLWRWMNSLSAEPE